MNTACLSSCRIGSETNLYRATHTFNKIYVRFMQLENDYKQKPTTENYFRPDKTG